jgi:hypothetical protein
MNKIQRKIIMLNDAQRLAIMLDISGILAGGFLLTKKDFEAFLDEHRPGRPIEKKGEK